MRRSPWIEWVEETVAEATELKSTKSISRTPRPEYCVEWL